MDGSSLDMNSVPAGHAGAIMTTEDFDFIEFELWRNNGEEFLNVPLEKTFLKLNQAEDEPDIGSVYTRNNRVLSGPLGCSLRSIARTAHSLCNATLTLLTHSIHGLAHSLRSLPH